MTIRTARRTGTTGAIFEEPEWGVAKGSSVSWVAKLRGDKIQNASCQMGGREATR